MVRAILAGTKTQTRRVVKPTTGPHTIEQVIATPDSLAAFIRHRCPHGQPGDRLWVRETWQAACGNKRAARIMNDPRPDRGWIEYAATCTDGPPRWRPSIHMPRWASRITLELTGVRVERLQDISEADAMAEGVALCARRVVGLEGGGCDSYLCGYRQLWKDINGPGSWDANPWVWVLEFRRVQ